MRFWRKKKRGESKVDVSQVRHHRTEIAKPSSYEELLNLVRLVSEMQNEKLAILSGLKEIWDRDPKEGEELVKRRYPQIQRNQLKCISYLKESLDSNSGNSIFLMAFSSIEGIDGDDYIKYFDFSELSVRLQELTKTIETIEKRMQGNLDLFDDSNEMKLITELDKITASEVTHSNILGTRNRATILETTFNNLSGRALEIVRNGLIDARARFLVELIEGFSEFLEFVRNIAENIEVFKLNEADHGHFKKILERILEYCGACHGSIENLQIKVIYNVYKEVIEEGYKMNWSNLHTALSRVQLTNGIREFSHDRLVDLARILELVGDFSTNIELLVQIAKVINSKLLIEYFGKGDYEKILRSTYYWAKDGGDVVGFGLTRYVSYMRKLKEDGLLEQGYDSFKLYRFIEAAKRIGRINLMTYENVRSLIVFGNKLYSSGVRSEDIIKHFDLSIFLCISNDFESLIDGISSSDYTQIVKGLYFWKEKGGTPEWFDARVLFSRLNVCISEGIITETSSDNSLIRFLVSAQKMGIFRSLDAHLFDNLIELSVFFISLDDLTYEKGMENLPEWGYYVIKQYNVKGEIEKVGKEQFELILRTLLEMFTKYGHVENARNPAEVLDLIIAVDKEGNFLQNKRDFYMIYWFIEELFHSGVVQAWNLETTEIVSLINEVKRTFEGNTKSVLCIALFSMISAGLMNGKADKEPLKFLKSVRDILGVRLFNPFCSSFYDPTTINTIKGMGFGGVIRFIRAWPGEIRPLMFPGILNYLIKKGIISGNGWSKTLNFLNLLYEECSPDLRSVFFAINFYRVPDEFLQNLNIEGYMLYLKKRGADYATVESEINVGRVTIHTTSAYAGGDAREEGDEDRQDSYNNIINCIEHQGDFPLSGSTVKLGGHSSVTMGHTIGLREQSSIGVIFSGGYMYEAHSQDVGSVSHRGKRSGKSYRTGRWDFKERKSGYFGKSTYKHETYPEYDLEYRRKSIAEAGVYNELLLRGWTVAGIFFDGRVEGIDPLILKKLIEISKKLSNREYPNPEYLNRKDKKEIPKKIKRVFPIYEFGDGGEFGKFAVKVFEP